MLVALKLYDRIYDMLQYLGSGQSALLVYMTYEDDGYARRFGKAE